MISGDTTMPSRLKAVALRVVYPVIGVVVLLVLWGLASALASAPSILPSPVTCIDASLSMLNQGYWRDILMTSARAVTGWLCAVAIGVPLGLAVGGTRQVYAAVCAPLAFLRSIPAFVLLLIPTAMGLGGEWGRFLTIAFAGLLITIDECASAMAALPMDRVELVKAYAGNRWHVISKVALFEAFGRTVVPSAKTTLSICLIVSIVVESFSIPEHGVGARLLTVMSGVEMPMVYGFILLTGALGMLLNILIGQVASAIIFWEE